MSTDTIETQIETDKLAPHEHEHYLAIRQKEKEVRELEREYFDVKEECKEAKTAFEAADSALRTLIAAGPDAQLKLPLDAGQDAWRAVSIGTLSIDARYLKSLREAKLETLGALADWTAAHDGLNDIKGLGPEGIEQVSNRMETYWSEHPQDASAALETDCEKAEPSNDDMHVSFQFNDRRHRQGNGG